MSGIAAALPWLGPIGKGLTLVGRWIRARVKGREKDWTIAALVVVILLLLYWTSVSRREAQFYRALNHQLELSLKGTGQNAQVLLARIRDKDRENDELRGKTSEVRCDGDWTETVLPDGTRTRRCVGKSESAETEQLRRMIRELEARGPLPFVQPPLMTPPPSLAAAARSRWSVGAGGGAVRVNDAWQPTAYGRAAYRFAGPWGAELILMAPVVGALVGPQLQP